MNIDTINGKIAINGSEIELFSPEGFKVLSDLWLKVGWDQKYLYGFSWLGRPIIQNPDDMVRMQEVIYDLKPDLIIETGVAHGGSVIFYASLLEMIGKGRVLGIDIEVREHNLKAIMDHKLSKLIDLEIGSSIDKKLVDKVSKKIKTDDKVLVILDSAHDYKHVKQELELYSPLVSKNSYIVVTDGSQEFLHDTPRAKLDYPGYVDSWELNNPKKAAEDFVKENKEFIIHEPTFPFNEGQINFRVTHWPSAFIRKIS